MPWVLPKSFTTEYASSSSSKSEPDLWNFCLSALQGMEQLYSSRDTESTNIQLWKKWQNLSDSFCYFNPGANTSILETIINQMYSDCMPHTQTETITTKMFWQKRKPSLFNKNSTYGKGITREKALAMAPAVLFEGLSTSHKKISGPKIWIENFHALWPFHGQEVLQFPLLTKKQDRVCEILTSLRGKKN